MENLDITILTSILAVAFIIFLLATYREFRIMDKNPYESNKRGQTAIQLSKFVDKLFQDQSIPKAEKKNILNLMDKAMADMETDGVYFDEEVKNTLKKQSQELN